METATGISILSRIVSGTLHICRRGVPRPEPVPGLGTKAEMARFDAARLAAQQQLEALYHRAEDQLGSETAAIFDIHWMILEDGDYRDMVRDVLEEDYTAEYAVSAAWSRFAAMFTGMSDPYLSARASDVEDVSRRMLNALSGDREAAFPSKGAIILATEDLTPSDVMRLDRTCIRGFVTRRGSADSHSAILAQALGIPALVGVAFDGSWEGHPALLDGRQGRLYIDPEDVS